MTLFDLVGSFQELKRNFNCLAFDKTTGGVEVFEGPYLPKKEGGKDPYGEMIFFDLTPALRVEHVLQAVRTKFQGIGFQNLTVTIDSTVITVSGWMNFE
jgi:hypothetical protein